MTPQKRNSWNRGKTGLEAGWTPERRAKASVRQRAWCKANPKSSFFQYDRQARWKTGPDPQVRQHYYRFLRMRCQARYWCQDWTIKWEDYLDLLKSAPGKWGRTNGSINLVRRDTLKGWHLDNVELMERSASMSRPRAVDPDTGKCVKRRRKSGRKPQHWRKTSDL